MDREPVLKLRLYFCAFVVSLVFVCTSMAQPRAASRFVPDEILVKFSAGLSAEQRLSANRAVGATVLETLGDLRWQRVRLPHGVNISDATSRYERLAGVESVQPNFYYHLLVTPNDPQFTDPGMYGLTKISAPTAWDLSTGSSDVVVADIDTGLRYIHEDIAGNTWVNPGEIAANGVDDDANGFIDDVYGADLFFNDGDPWDEHGHGTHTAGTIGASGNNALGVVGVNWNVKIMPIKIYNNTGFGTTSAMLVNAYNYVRAMRERGVNVRVTNNSYGGCDEACGYDQATKDAIDALGYLDVLQVFAAGNQANNNDSIPFYPATYTSPSIMSVASSTANDTRSGFSSYGLNSVDLAAPGSGILSTTFDSNSSYGLKSGTSMATPHVAGAAALLAALNPGLSAASIKATLMNNVDLLSEWNGLVRSGGRLNIDRAMRNQTPCSFTPSSTLINASTKGGAYSVNVTAGPNCDYFVKSEAPWIRLLDGDTRSGNSTISFRVTLNPTIARTGTIVVGGTTITVRQSRSG